VSLAVDFDSALASRLVAVAGIVGSVVAIEPLAGGVGSAVFGVRTDGPDVVVKIYPEHARASLHKELWVYEYLAQHAPSLPVPKVLAVDESGSLLPQAFSVLTRLDGVYLRSKLERFASHDLVGVYRQMGSTLRTLHDVELPQFGEVMPGRGTRYLSNRAFMLRQFELALETFERLGGDRLLHGRLNAYVSERRELLDGPERASFCHNDGHDANMLVTPSRCGWVLSGLLDFEHALAGDPLFDLAKTYYFAPNHSEELLAGLTESHTPLSTDWRDAFTLYFVYHQLRLWNLLAGLAVTDRLPGIAEELDRTLAAPNS
jgi:aminoglycoside phosphotransferase (APT) family kinase protein